MSRTTTAAAAAAVVTSSRSTLLLLALLPAVSARRPGHLIRRWPSLITSTLSAILLLMLLRPLLSLGHCNLLLVGELLTIGCGGPARIGIVGVAVGIRASIAASVGLLIVVHGCLRSLFRKMKRAAWWMDEKEQTQDGFDGQRHGRTGAAAGAGGGVIVSGTTSQATMGHGERRLRDWLW